MKLGLPSSSLNFRIWVLRVMDILLALSSAFAPRLVGFACNDGDQHFLSKTRFTHCLIKEWSLSHSYKYLVLLSLRLLAEKWKKREKWSCKNWWGEAKGSFHILLTSSSQRFTIFPKLTFFNSPSKIKGKKTALMLAHCSIFATNS